MAPRNAWATVNLCSERRALLVAGLQMPTTPPKSLIALVTPAVSIVAAVAAGGEEPPLEPPPPQELARKAAPTAIAPVPTYSRDLEPLYARMMQLLEVKDHRRTQGLQKIERPQEWVVRIL
jgi:hypothetical protein